MQAVVAGLNLPAPQMDACDALAGPACEAAPGQSASSRGTCDPQRGFLCGQGHPGSWLQVEEAPGGPGWGWSAPRPSLRGGQTWPGPALSPTDGVVVSGPSPASWERGSPGLPLSRWYEADKAWKGPAAWGAPGRRSAASEGLHPGLPGWEWQEPRPRDEAGLKPFIYLRVLCSLSQGQALFDGFTPL